MAGEVCAVTLVFGGEYEVRLWSWFNGGSMVQTREEAGKHFRAWHKSILTQGNTVCPHWLRVMTPQSPPNGVQNPKLEIPAFTHTNLPLVFNPGHIDSYIEQIPEALRPV